MKPRLNRMVLVIMTVVLVVFTGTIVLASMVTPKSNPLSPQQTTQRNQDQTATFAFIATNNEYAMRVGLQTISADLTLTRRPTITFSAEQSRSMTQNFATVQILDTAISATETRVRQISLTAGAPLVSPTFGGPPMSTGTFIYLYTTVPLRATQIRANEMTASVTFATPTPSR